MIEQWISVLYDIVWNPGLVYLCLGVGLYFTWKTRAIQIRGLKEAGSVLMNSKSDKSGVSAFEALSLTIAGRVGTGNIAGVATAIYFGGPGSVFWMWVIAIIGASSAFIETTLGQIYKREINGEFRGSPAFYMESALGMPKFATFFALVTLASIGFFMPGVQSNSIAAALNTAFDVPVTASAIGITVALSFLIFGGIKRLAKFAAYVVPFMAQAYLVIAVFIICVNYDKVPAMFHTIFTSAFGTDAVFGGIVGSAFSYGVMRGIFSNEAGQGTAVHASSAATCSHPVKQGLVQTVSVYVDTLIVCSCTAFMILVTGCYNIKGADGLIVENLPGMEIGPGYTQAALEGVLPGLGSGFVAVALLFFAFTTLVAYWYIADTSVSFLNRNKDRVWLRIVFNLLLLFATAYGALRPVEMVWNMGDIGVGIMAWINIIVIVFLQKKAIAALNDYEDQRRRGIDPVFHPDAIGIENADYWKGRRAEQNRDHPAAGAPFDN